MQDKESIGNLDEGMIRFLEAARGGVRHRIVTVGDEGAGAFSLRANFARLKKLHKADRHIMMAIRSLRESQICAE